MREVHVLADHEEASLSAAAWLCYHTARRSSGGFSLALSGGTSPLRLFELLGGDPYRAAMPWGALRLFWADERCVPPDHPDSNYAACAERMLDRVPLDAGAVHRIEGELGPEAAAEQYAGKLKGYFGRAAAFPCFDLIVLGIGTDGHVASIFPRNATLRPTTEWVTAMPGIGATPAVPRVSLALPVLCAAKTVMFLVTGAGKRDIVRTLLQGREPALPAARIKGPRQVWFLDQAAGN